MADFRELLAKPMDDVKRPPALPAGVYHGVVSNHEFGTSSRKQTPFVRYTYTLQSLHEGDEANLEGIDLSKRNPASTFYITEDALYRLKDFLESVGVSVGGRAVSECIPEAMNARVLVTITQRNSEDGKEIYNDVASVRGEE